MIDAVGWEMHSYNGRFLHTVSRICGCVGISQKIPNSQKHSKMLLTVITSRSPECWLGFQCSVMPFRVFWEDVWAQSLLCCPGQDSSARARRAVQTEKLRTSPSGEVTWPHLVSNFTQSGDDRFQESQQSGASPETNGCQSIFWTYLALVGLAKYCLIFCPSLWGCCLHLHSSAFSRPFRMCQTSRTMNIWVR